ncbi:hypothetical protein WMY93_031217 [Mugilogobius chulae]|uniref:SCP domain-containing protein n=1 Tax=Mugilogobius chulae TaxID=88201 RepID=A0AAW0MGV1_9GOBI
MLVLWILLLGFSFGHCEDLPDITDRNFIELCVKEHNRARSRVQPPATDMRFMSWDSGLAAIARSYARRCIFQHSTERSQHPDFSQLGENLWVGAPPSVFSVTYAFSAGSMRQRTTTTTVTPANPIGCVDTTLRWCGLALTKWAVLFICAPKASRTSTLDLELTLSATMAHLVTGEVRSLIRPTEPPAPSVTPLSPVWTTSVVTDGKWIRLRPLDPILLQF